MTIWNVIRQSEWQANCMSSPIKITPEQLGAVIGEQVELYRKSVELKVDRCGAKAIKKLVQVTKATAPMSAKHRGRHYVECIASRRESSRIGTSTYTWYVQAPCYRLTHLLVNGHATKDGDRTKKNPFLKNACDQVQAEYEQNVLEAVKNDL